MAAPSFGVRELTSPEDLKRRRVPQQSAWCPALTIEQFLAREDRLAAHPWARERMRTWILVSPAELELGGEEHLSDHALASLETFRQDAIGPGNERGSIYGVASVFVAPELRGRSYATRLCSAIRQRLKEEDPGAFGAVLYSDVGPSIYAKAGFAAPPAPPVSHLFRFRDDPDSHSRAEAAAGGVEWLTRDSIGAVVDSLAAEVAETASGDELIVLPSSGQILWLLEREVAVAEQLSRGPLSSCAARCAGSLVVWTADMAKEKCYLKILLVKAGPDDAATSAAIAAALLAAQKGGVYGTGAVSWGPAGVLGRWPVAESALADAGVTFEETPRTGSLPMIAPLRDGIAPSQWHFIPQAIWL